MAKQILLAGTTSWIDYVRITDMNGSPITGLVFNSSGLLAKYVLAGAASVAITLATQTVTGAYSSGGFVEVDATAFPGMYRLDVPNAALASGNKSFVSVYGFSGMNVSMIQYALVAYNPQDAVRLGLTALPNANAAASGGLMILGTNATAVSFTAGMTVSNPSGAGLTLSSGGGNGAGLDLAGNGSGSGLHSVGGTTGRGAHLVGGATSGAGLRSEAVGGNGTGIHGFGAGSGTGFRAEGGPTGPGALILGGATSGDGIDITTTLGDGISVLPTAGSGIVSTGNGTNKHGMVVTGSAAGTGDGLKAVAGAGGVDIRGNQTGNVTGNLSGSVGSVTGNVGGNVVGSVASVVAGVTLAASAVQAIWDALTSALTTVGSIGKLIVTNLDALISSRMATYTQPTGFLAAVFPGLVASTTNITAGTITTATNLTNAPTSGDFTAVMKTSLGTAVGVAQTGDSFARLGAPAGASVSADIASVQADTDNIQTRLPAVLVSGRIDASVGSYPGNAAQSGDSFARLGAPAGASVSADIAQVEAGVVAIPTANQNADAYLDRADAIETGLTPRQAERIIAAASAGKLSGAATTAVVIRNAQADSKDRISATVDSSGNRTAVTLDVS